MIIFALRLRAGKPGTRNNELYSKQGIFGMDFAPQNCGKVHVGDSLDAVEFE